MTRFPTTKTLGSAAALAAVVFAVMLIASPPGQASGQRNATSEEASEIQIGFAIAPVPLNLEGKNRALVGLGSYIVNAQGDCAGCHSNPEFAPDGNPYFGQPKKLSASGYLGGGVDFGPLIPDTPHIVTRNLTPDKTGRPEGGHTFQEFVQIIRTGVDMDHLHPSCSATVTTNCLPKPFDGELLQIMPWPTYQSMTDHDLRAIYEYLSAIPCIEGPPAPSPLHNECQ